MTVLSHEFWRNFAEINDSPSRINGSTAPITDAYIFTHPGLHDTNIVTQMADSIRITRMDRPGESLPYKGRFVGISNDRNVVFELNDLHFIKLSKAIYASLDKEIFKDVSVKAVKFSSDNRWAAIIADGTIFLIELSASSGK